MRTALLLVACALAWSPLTVWAQTDDDASAPQTTEPFTLTPGSPYLVFDPRLAGRVEAAQMKVHPFTRHPANPLVVPEHPWEAISEDAEPGLSNRGRIQLGTVLYDQAAGLWRMWYWSYSTAPITCYAYSHDGVNWTKPELGLRSYNESTANNIIRIGDPFGNVYLQPGAEPERRFVQWQLQWRPSEDGAPADYAIYRMFSPDGLTWRRDPREPVAPGLESMFGGTLGDVGVVLYFPSHPDAPYQNYRTLGEPNPNPAPQDQPKNMNTLRTLVRIPSADGVNFDMDKASIAYRRDKQDAPVDQYLQFYGGPSVVRHGDMYLGFPWLYHSNEGDFNIGFSYSLDTRTWERPFRGQYVLPKGAHGQWDSQMLLSAPIIVEKDGLWWMYYAGCPYPHREGKRYFAIGLARMKAGRVVSAQSWDGAGSLTVGPLVLGGHGLRVNARVIDHLSVEVLDADGQPIPGLRSKPVIGDGDALEVHWPQDAPTDRLSGEPVMLRFHIEDADLFGLSVAP